MDHPPPHSRWVASLHDEFLLCYFCALVTFYAKIPGALLSPFKGAFPPFDKQAERRGKKGETSIILFPPLPSPLLHPSPLSSHSVHLDSRQSPSESSVLHTHR